MDDENAKTLLCVTHERLRRAVDEMIKVEIDMGVGVDLLYGQEPPADFLTDAPSDDKKTGNDQ